MLGDINPQAVRIVQQAVVYPGHNHVTALNNKERLRGEQGGWHVGA